MLNHIMLNHKLLIGVLLGILVFSLGQAGVNGTSHAATVKSSQANGSVKAATFSSPQSNSGSLGANSTQQPYINQTSPPAPSQSQVRKDPHVPCTTQGTWGSPSGQPACGGLYQGAYGYSSFGSYSQVSSVQVSVNFAGTNPASLGSNNWAAGGISAYGGACCIAYDEGYNIYAGVDNTGTVSLDYYVLESCEYKGYSNCPNNYYLVGAQSESATYVICYGSCGTVNYQTDKIDLYFYWCTSSDCQSYWSVSCPHVGPHGVFIADARDTRLSSAFWTFGDICPSANTESNPSFYFGMINVYPWNGPYNYAYGYEMGVTQDVVGYNYLGVVQLSNPLQGGNQVPHAQTIGSNSEPWWHINWWWGDQANFNYYAVVPLAPIDNLQSAWVDGQKFTAMAGSTTECVQVYSGGFSGIKGSADSYNEGHWLLGTWIVDHSWANGLYWNLISSNSACSPEYIAWINNWNSNYQYAMPDESQVW